MGECKRSKQTRQQKWEALVEQDKTDPKNTGISDWKNIDQIKNAALNWGNNGQQRHGKFFGIDEYIWETQRGKKNKILAIRTLGFDENIAEAKLLKNRPIAKRIRDHYNGSRCVACNRTDNMVIDHKNDLYNDPRVHNTKTQEVSDFQPLCNSCNLVKRAACSKTRKTGLRQPAPFPVRNATGVDFIEGDETFDPNGLGLRGTYWYDPQAYNEYCKRQRQNKK